MKNKLIMSNTRKRDGRFERTYYINSKQNKNRIGSSNRINNLDSEEKTLQCFVNKGLTAKEIKAFSKPVIKDDKKIQPYSTYFEEEKTSQIQLALYINDERIQTIVLGEFPDKYCGFYQAHKIATRILDEELKEITVVHKNNPQAKCKIKFYEIEDNVVPQEDIFNDKELELQEALNEKTEELYQLSLENAKLKKENHELHMVNKDQELLLDMYHNEYKWREVVTCPDCGKERYRLYSPEKDKYFLGCSSGEHHETRPYDKLAHLCYEEGFIRDLWVESHDKFMYPKIGEDVK